MAKEKAPVKVTKEKAPVKVTKEKAPVKVTKEKALGVLLSFKLSGPELAWVVENAADTVRSFLTRHSPS